MENIPDNRYVPFLKGKAGEIKALGEFREVEGVTPLIEVPEQKLIFEKTGTSIEPIDKSLEGYARRLASAWGKLDFCFVDLGRFPKAARMADGTHPVEAFFADARQADLAAIPVIGLDRDGAHLEAAEDAYKTRPTGVALRLRCGDMQKPTLLAAELPKFLRLIDQEPEEVDLLLDFGELLAGQTGAVKAEALAAIAALPFLERWRSLVLSSGSFPAQISQHIKPKEDGSRPRREWSLWQDVCSIDPPPARLPSYGDYVATGAEWPTPFNPKTMNPAAKIVYATEAEWLIVRGRSFREHGGAQYRQLSTKLTKSSAFAEVGSCAVETKIRQCAEGGGKTGNLEQWVSAATLRHIEVVRRQLANPAAVVAAP